MAANIQDAILLFGDSITEEGWERSGLSQLLAATYVRKFDVINRGHGGYQTEWAIPLFEQIFAKQNDRQGLPKVQLLIIGFGANDAAPPPSPQYVPREQYGINLTRLVEMVKSPMSPYYSRDTRVILITPPPVNTYQWTVDVRSLEQTRLYAETVKEVGAATGAPVADVWTRIWEAAGRDELACEDFLHDGLHLNAAGYKIAFRTIMKIIAENYPEILPNNLQTVFIPWPHKHGENPRLLLTKRSAIQGSQETPNEA